MVRGVFSTMTQLQTPTPQILTVQEFCVTPAPGHAGGTIQLVNRDLQAANIDMSEPLTQLLWLELGAEVKTRRGPADGQYRQELAQVSLMPAGAQLLLIPRGPVTAK